MTLTTAPLRSVPSSLRAADSASSSEVYSMILRESSRASITVSQESSREEGTNPSPVERSTSARVTLPAVRAKSLRSYSREGRGRSQS